VRRAFLGIDCGTQSTKLVLVDAESLQPKVVGHAQHRIVEREDGTREQDPAEWIDALVNAAGGVARDDVEIAGIGVSGQQHGLVCLDDADEPVRPAKLWNDTTTAAECIDLTERLGGPKRVLALTGNAFLPGYTAPKVEWLRRHEPDSYLRTKRMCLPHDYLNLWLTGTYATEPGDASGTAYFDARTREYAGAVLAAIDDARDWNATLPPVTRSLSVIGSLRPSAAGALGLPPGVPVSAGGGDNMCSAIGIGLTSEGAVGVSLGTSATAFAHRGAPAIDPAGEAAAFCDSTGGWLPLVCTLNCGGVVNWVLELVGRDLSALDPALRTSPPGANGLSFLPHLDGERTPNLPAGTGSFAGVRSMHRTEDFIRAAVEGVTFGVHYAFGALRRAGVEETGVYLVGGGSHSDEWGQLLADVLGMPVRRSVAEAAGAGAAMQARWVVDAAEPIVTSEGGWQPRKVAALDEARERLMRLRTLALDGAL
jgi:xylulokinase